MPVLQPVLYVPVWRTAAARSIRACLAYYCSPSYTCLLRVLLQPVLYVPVWRTAAARPIRACLAYCCSPFLRACLAYCCSPSYTCLFGVLLQLAVVVTAELQVSLVLAVGCAPRVPTAVRPPQRRAGELVRQTALLQLHTVGAAPLKQNTSPARTSETEPVTCPHRARSMQYCTAHIGTCTLIIHLQDQQSQRHFPTLQHRSSFGVLAIAVIAPGPITI